MRRFEAFVSWLNDKFVETWSQVFVYISAVCLVSMTLVITLYVFLRKYTEVRMYFVEEWSSFGFVLMTFFCAGYVMRKNEFIRMENLVRRLSVTKRKVLELVLGLTAMFVISYFIQRSFSLFLMYWKSGAVSMFATKTPLWIPSMFIPLGLALFDLVMFGYWLQVLVDLVQSIKRQSASTS